MAEYIDRQAAIDALKRHRSLFCEKRVDFLMLSEKDKARVDEIDTCISELLNLQTVQPERKKGKWIWDDEGYHCSECWFHAHGNTLECMDGTYRFCPHCGAEMEGE